MPVHLDDVKIKLPMPFYPPVPYIEVHSVAWFFPESNLETNVHEVPQCSNIYKEPQFSNTYEGMYEELAPW